MIRRLVFRPQARSDITEAIAWYETQGQGLGADFVRAVEVASASIQANPFQHQRVRGGGVPGVVIRLGRGFNEVTVESGNRIRAGTAVPDVKVSRAAQEAALAG